MGFNRLPLNTVGRETQLYPIFLLDGGLGTTLEDVFHKDITHPLWSARLVDEDEETIVAAHLAFLRAGSQIILTSTYQAAYETFRRAKYTDVDAEQLMRKSVKLAADACRAYGRENTSLAQSTTLNRSLPLVALSLGPYGATLDTAAEFTGEYPPPYGPSSPPPRGAVSVSEEQSHEDALAAFHFSRLLVYARDVVTWNVIDVVAFETIPLVTEAKAIRRAVARLEDWFRETNYKVDNQAQYTRGMKPWYISFVFPGSHGEFSQYRNNEVPSEKSYNPTETRNELDEWRPYTPCQIAQAVFSVQNDGCKTMAIPDGIGINCTKFSAILQIMDEFITTMKNLLSSSPERLGNELPWLALSPNGGAGYDPIERTWIAAAPNSQVGAVPSLREWVRSGRGNLGPSQSPQWVGIFGGLLLGGCCKTGTNEIRDLKEVLSA